MQIKAILFDFDHTLGDRRQYAYAAYSFFVNTAIRRKKTIKIDAFTVETIVQECMVLDQQGNVDKMYVRNEIQRKYAIDLGENFAERWNRELWRYTVLFPNVKEVLQELRTRGYSLGVITNGNCKAQHQKLRQVGLEDFFDVLLISDEAGIRKPDPAIYRMAAEKLALPCAACAFVGDLWQTDLLGAHRAGMMPIWMTADGVHPCASGLVRQISSIDMLLDIFPAL